MDDESHRLVLTAMFQVLSGKTVVIVTHRLEHIMDFDLVLVLADGIIVESGDPKELLENKASQLQQYVKRPSAVG